MTELCKNYVAMRESVCHRITAGLDDRAGTNKILVIVKEEHVDDMMRNAAVAIFQHYATGKPLQGYSGELCAHVNLQNALQEVSSAFDVCVVKKGPPQPFFHYVVNSNSGHYTEMFEEI